MTVPNPILLAQVTLACLLALAALWWFVRGARRWARRRSLRQCLEQTGLDETPLPLLDEAFDQARQQLQGDGSARPQVLYHTPWVLFLGDAASRVPDLLRAAGPATTAHGDARDSFWRWWVMARVVAIEIDARLVEPEDEAGPPPARQLLAGWYRALLALAERRGALPLDGIALCVDARSLLAGPQAVTALAARLRQRADEASQHLRLRLPTQVLVTGLDQLPGYAAVREALPADVLAQAVGFRVPAGTLVIIDDVLNDLSERLRALQMALLRQQADATGRRAVHEFFLHWLALQAGLGVFLKRLFAPATTPDAATYRLRGRGLYFVAAPAQERPPAFVLELFTRFLPMERAFPGLRR